MTAVELRQLQARDLDASKATAFASAMTVLIDSGYRILTADLASGLITATASTTGRLKVDPTGLYRASQTPQASVFVEERISGSSRVRIVFSIRTSNSGRAGTADEKAILTPDLYTNFFSRLGEEVNERSRIVGSAGKANASKPVEQEHLEPRGPLVLQPAPSETTPIVPSEEDREGEADASPKNFDRD